MKSTPNSAQNYSIKKTCMAVFLVSSVMLGACFDSGSSRSASTTQTNATSDTAKGSLKSPEILAQKTTGFIVGNSMAPSTVIIYYDMQCPHCGHLWESVQALIKAEKNLPVNFKWVPVGLLNKASVSQGATILAAKDPISLMNQHEASLLARSGGISADSDAVSKFEKVVQSNSDSLESIQSEDERGVPMIIGRSKLTTEVVTKMGSTDVAGLKLLLGL